MRRVYTLIHAIVMAIRGQELHYRGNETKHIDNNHRVAHESKKKERKEIKEHEKKVETLGGRCHLRPEKFRMAPCLVGRHAKPLE